MFARWSPIYELEVTENQYSAPGACAAEAINILRTTGPASPKIVDVGIGTGLLAQQIYDACLCRITGLDFSEDMMAVAAARDIVERLIKCDVGKDTWPVETASCDFVVSAGLIEYLTPEMLRHFLFEAKRVLQVGGSFVATYKPRETQQKGIAIWPGHSGTYLTCSYFPEEIADLLRSAGFSIAHHAPPFKGCIFSDGTSYNYRLISARS